MKTKDNSSDYINMSIDLEPIRLDQCLSDFQQNSFENSYNKSEPDTNLDLDLEKLSEPDLEKLLESDTNLDLDLEKLSEPDLEKILEPDLEKLSEPNSKEIVESNVFEKFDNNDNNDQNINKNKIGESRLRKKSPKRENLNIYDKGYTKQNFTPHILAEYPECVDVLNDFQKEILVECINKNEDGFGLSLPMGSGKTIIALILALYYHKTYSRPALVVVSKTLLESWKIEIETFFGKNYPYQVIHSSFCKIDSVTINCNAKIVLTTIEMLVKSYVSNNIDLRFIKKILNHESKIVNYYCLVSSPLIKANHGLGLFYATYWSAVFIDEAQKYTNVDTKGCQALGSLCSEKRCLLSGTLIDEPKAKRILGYNILINDRGAPRNLPETSILIYSTAFKGTLKTMVHRNKNDAFKQPEVNEKIISHELSYEEIKIYIMMKIILAEVKKNAINAKLLQNAEDSKKFSGYILAMVSYLRQALLCPLIPISSVAISAMSCQETSELTQLINNQFKKLGLSKWLQNIDSAKSSRIKEIINCVSKHNNDKIIIFSCFSSFLDILRYYLIEDQPNKNIFRLLSKHDISQRKKILETFKDTNNSILLVTYNLGAEGLNLQFASTVMLADAWWNSSKMSQAISRIFRMGQIKTTINVYFFTSNTGMEEIVLKKQCAKETLIEELKFGMMTSSIPKLSMNEIIKMIEMEDNTKLLKKITYYKR